MASKPVVLALGISGAKVAKMGLWEFFDTCAAKGGVQFLVPGANGSGEVVRAISRVDYEGREDDLVFALHAKPELLGKCDVVLSKITNALVSSNGSVVEGARSFSQDVESQSGLAHLDPLTGQEATLDRDSIGRHLVLMEDSLENSLLRNPRHISYESTPAAGGKFDTSGLQFPVVCKTRQAGGDASAHKMGIAFSEEGLHDFPTPFIAQEYFNHDNAVFKVFVVGDFIYTVKRPSVPNLPENLTKTLFFDSQHPLEPQLRPHMGAESVSNNDVADPAEELVRTIVEALSKEFSLSLFGFDLIRNNKTGQFGVIDLNYFPGYIGVPNFPERLYDHIRQTGLRARGEES